MMLPPVAILAGGLSTRLYPVTKTTPKALLDVAGKPFICHQLKLLASKGISRVVLCVGNMGEMIESYVGDGSKFGLSVEYSYDGKALLGTGGALIKALPKLGEIFFVIYGDSYLFADYEEVHRKFLSSGKKALMTVFKNEGKWDSSNTVFENGSVLKYDKKTRTPEMKYIDYGLAIISKEVFAGIPEAEAVDLADIYRGLASSGQMAGLEVFERFYEIGSFSGLEELNKLLGGK